MSPRQTWQCKRGARRRRKWWWGAGPAGGTPVVVVAAAAEGGRWMGIGAGGWGRALGLSDLPEEAGEWPRSTAG